MVIEITKNENQATVSRFLRALAQSIDDGDVFVRNVAKPDPVTKCDPASITWTPEIQFIVVSTGSRQLLETLNQSST